MSGIISRKFRRLSSPTATSILFRFLRCLGQFTSPTLWSSIAMRLQSSEISARRLRVPLKAAFSTPADESALALLARYGCQTGDTFHITASREPIPSATHSLPMNDLYYGIFFPGEFSNKTYPFPTGSLPAVTFPHFTPRTVRRTKLILSAGSKISLSFLMKKSAFTALYFPSRTLLP